MSDPTPQDPIVLMTKLAQHRSALLMAMGDLATRQDWQTRQIQIDEAMAQIVTRALTEALAAAHVRGKKRRRVVSRFLNVLDRYRRLNAVCASDGCTQAVAGSIYCHAHSGLCPTTTD